MQLIGHCAVDSGQVMIVDPCYVIKDYKSGQAENEYTEVCDMTLSEAGHGEVLGGFVTRTLYGDGRYPVYAEMDSHGRIVKMTIDFDPDGSTDENECQRCMDQAEEGEEYCWRCAEQLGEEDEDADEL